MDLKTVEYYNDHAIEYYNSTCDVDMRDLYKLFEVNLTNGDSILDVGCGSGRDSYYFLRSGYSVTAIDPSKELARLASERIGIEVINTPIQAINFTSQFKGIWACASLLHIPFLEMPAVLRKLHEALEDGGTLFISLKKGDYEGYRNGRYFCDYDVPKFEQLHYTDIGYQLVNYQESLDKRPGRNQAVWLNIVLRKPNYK
ncbi:MAG: class I SAM-dependent methyltransferase [Candidatus Cloacimonetes bacterium HGW-Cloacimonetes-1]|jgi:2-polyprenyl-3-methyl-5-hydroxy-6-metoxy-1,4-benzoquinol methylase|nr:MAG: class I SAM-dependent methyltransferase [Candidatus Cloacimonetes bacterium HGW-Cloacimonetes-1]